MLDQDGTALHSASRHLMTPQVHSILAKHTSCTGDRAPRHKEQDLVSFQMRFQACSAHAAPRLMTCASGLASGIPTSFGQQIQLQSPSSCTAHVAPAWAHSDWVCTMQAYKLPCGTQHACAASGNYDIVRGAYRGFAAATAQVAYYAAPLSTLLKVVRQRSSASLHFPLCLANAINVACWLSYGVVSLLPPAHMT